MLKIGFIGGGKMAQALAKGFLSAKLTKGELLIASCHPSDYQSSEAFKSLGGVSVFENVPVVEKSDIVFLSVKPNVMSVVSNELNKVKIDTNKLFLSIVMGVPMKKLEESLPSDGRIIRIMTNTAAVVGSAASVYTLGKKCTEEDAKITKKLLDSVGTCEEVPETFLDTITALSGSGPAFVYVMIEALADGSVKMGVPRDLAYRLAAQTVLGAGKMVYETSIHPGILKDNVASPAGTTAAGLHYLEQEGFRAAVIGAIETATKRAREVSQQQT